MELVALVDCSKSGRKIGRKRESSCLGIEEVRVR